MSASKKSKKTVFGTPGSVAELEGVSKLHSVVTPRVSQQQQKADKGPGAGRVQEVFFRGGGKFFSGTSVLLL